MPTSVYSYVSLFFNLPLELQHVFYIGFYFFMSIIYTYFLLILPSCFSTKTFIRARVGSVAVFPHGSIYH